MAEIPRTSRAAVLREFGQPITIEEFAVPELDPGALLMRVDSATVCGTDVHIQHGRLPAARLPLVLGHESTGTIVASNGRSHDSNDSPLQPGDRIVFVYPWCGTCYWCSIARQPTLCQNARMYGWGPSDVRPYLTGTFADFVYVQPQCRVLKVPDHLDPSVVASTTCALRTVMHAFERLGALGPILSSDTVAILGSGAVGLYATAVALSSGAKSVLLFGAPASRLEIGRRWGASVVADVTATSPGQREALVLENTNGRGADVTIDCAGPVSAFQEALNLTRRGGRVLEIGVGNLAEVPIHPYFFNIKMISVIGSLSGAAPHFYQALQFVDRHKNDFDFAALTVGAFDLLEVNAALAAVADQDLIKPQITTTAR